MRFILLFILSIIPILSTARTECAAGEMTLGYMNCLWSRPVIDTPPDWERDDEFGNKNENVTFFPANPNFGKSIIYVSSVYKPNLKTKTLDDFIQNEQKEFLERAKTNFKVTEEPNLKTADGKPLKAFKFESTYNGRRQFDLVAYGEEDDMFLIFALTSLSSEGFAASQQSFEILVSNYHK